MPVRRASAVLLILAVCASEMGLCAGWSNSARDRMACCERTGGDCGSLSADDCCAVGEQRQNVEGTAALFIARPATVGRLPVASLLRLSAAGSFSLIDRHNTYLLDSVFRI